MRMLRRLVPGLAGLALLVGGCLGNDYLSSPIALGDSDVGAWVVVEPGDGFELGLLGHPAHPQAGWAVVTMDEAIVVIDRQVHEPLGTIPPDDDYLRLLPDPVQELWSSVPVPDRPPDVDEPEGPMWLYPFTHFLFSGRELGETDLRLELWVADDLIHDFALRVSVVEEACDYFEGQDSATKVPHRCG